MNSRHWLCHYPRHRLRGRPINFNPTELISKNIAIDINMAISLELENGLIKEYPTSYIFQDPEDEITIHGMCDISCDHLNCAISAAEEASKFHKRRSWIFLFACIFWILPGIVFSRDVTWMGLANPIAGVYALAAIYYIWHSRRFAKNAKELIEFRDHGTINRVKLKNFKTTY